jgi:hypothetical protein
MKSKIPKTIMVAAGLITLLGCDAFKRPIDVRGVQSPYTNAEYPPGTRILGYTLPPEPDHEKNDQTLQGIDDNHNQMRDDLERYAIIHSSLRPKHQKVYAALMLQYTKDKHYFIEHHETCEDLEHLNRSWKCSIYVGDIMMDRGIDFDSRYQDTLFQQIDLNTQERYELWLNQEQSLMGKCTISTAYNKEIDCDADFLKKGEF